MPICAGHKATIATHSGITAAMLHHDDRPRHSDKSSSAHTLRNTSPKIWISDHLPPKDNSEQRTNSKNRRCNVAIIATKCN